MTVCVLTCSTGRPEALTMCRLWMSRQTAQHRHLVVEGGTLLENFRRGLGQVTEDHLVICEDDDWYSPRWVEIQLALLARSESAGQRETVNYHIPSGGVAIRPHPERFSSLHCTSVRRSAIPRLLACLDDPEVEINGRIRIDCVYWEKHANDYLLHDGIDCVSMKGLPGNGGLSAKHNAGYYRQFDYDRSFLEHLIRDDVEHYRRFFDEVRGLPRASVPSGSQRLDLRAHLASLLAKRP